MESEPGLHEGEMHSSRDAIAFLVLLRQLLQNLHVEHVVVVNFFLSEAEALGYQDGVTHCRERGDTCEGRGLCCPHS